ncbi:MAG: exodeoxyribonuclease VII large subunit [Candidatus Nomurabacteria bacterium]|jgi:exodeoxyribonuclease VII large subunit|nr:exodeoxyribonuclease VII large subunit [Candidatus Nomurabacteria bacterium]
MIAPKQIFSVSDAAAVINQTLEYAFPLISVTGEVANFKISGQKWVFFDLKDEAMSLKCFMPAWNLRTEVADGMTVIVAARPRLGRYGFSLNIETLRPTGEGSIKKAFELLRAKLTVEGLFAPERKRSLPDLPAHIGVISSTGAAGYRDFLKILDARFGNMRVKVADTAVQGDGAADQMIRALEYFNTSSHPPEVVAILRGGGSRDDLAAFDDERLVRAIAGSRLPTIVGVGHEIDETLADLAADVRASTPSNAAEILVPDRREIVATLVAELRRVVTATENQLDEVGGNTSDSLDVISTRLDQTVERAEQNLKRLTGMLKQLDPKVVLGRGYAIVRAENGQVLRQSPSLGERLCIETSVAEIDAEVVAMRKKV